MHRQMKICNVRGGLIKDSNNDSVVRINVAPSTWPVKAAIKNGFRSWRKMIDHGMENVGKPGLPKYLDYKVFLNQQHTANPTINLPLDAAGNEVPAGEWTYSTYHTEDVDWSNYLAWATNRDTDSFQPMIVGPHLPGTGAGDIWSRVGLLQSWFDTRPNQDTTGTPVLPDNAITDPLANLFDEADAADEIIDMMQDDNDRPPYNEILAFGNGEAYAAQNNLQRVAFAATQTGAGQISAMNGFSAICGLIQVQITQGTGTGDVELLLDVDTEGVSF